jgi:hypothetical protein
MKYLKTFESLQPIDVESDVNEFWEKFGDYIKKRDEKTEERWRRESGIRKRTDDILDKYGYTMTDEYNYYEICETDDYGRCTSTLTTVRAVNREHARLKCANKYDGKKSKGGALEIFTTGFYTAKEVNIKKEISDTESQILALQRKLEELKRIN